MSFFKNFIKGELIDVIDWLDNSQDIIVHKFLRGDNEIKNGAQLTVRESQVAILVNEGKIADVFHPGRYELTTENMPVLTTLKSWKYGFDSPFKVDIFFINTKRFLDLKWGTPQKITMRDQDFGAVLVSAFGKYAIKVNNPVVFLKEVSGTNKEYSIQDTEKYLRSKLVSGFTDLLAESNVAVFDLATQLDELSDLGKKLMQRKFTDLGLELNDFVLENVNLPEAVQEGLEKRMKINATGGAEMYKMDRQLEAMEAAAKNEGGGNMAAAGMGMGMGMGMGSQMNQAMYAKAPEAKAISHQVPCPHCQKPLDPQAKFCSNCGKPPKEITKCIQCGKEIDKGSKFCMHCGSSQSKTCPKCNHEVKGPFCGNCGTKVE